MASPSPAASDPSKPSSSQPVAWIVGGSGGFGRILAEEVASRGYRVVIWGRQAERCDAAIAEICERIPHALVDKATVDVLQAEEVNRQFQKRYEQDQRLDLLVHCVGKSCRVAAENATPEMYQEWMQWNFQSAVNTNTVCLPWLIQAKGKLVNIGSLASRVAWPWIGPYAAGKRALASFTDTLRIELKDRVDVLLVCPGPIARDDAGKRYQEQSQGMAESANKPGAGAPVKMLDPQQLAKQIMDSSHAGQAELLVPGKTRWLMLAYAISCRWGDGLLARLVKR